MLLKEVSRAEVPKKAKEVLREFLDSGMDCAEAVPDGESAMRLRNRLRAAALRGCPSVTVTMRGGRVFLLRKEAEHA